MVVLLLCMKFTEAQLPNFKSGNPLGSFRNMGGRQNSDTIAFEHRDDLKDSITIYYFHLNSLVRELLDSSLNDYGKVYTVPAGYKTLGNNGNAAYPILFTPLLKAGWDAGFHAYDLYKFSLDNTRFFQTTKPYTQLGYYLASGKEQVVKVLQTQNIKPNWNAGFEYQLISAPGFFQTKIPTITVTAFFQITGEKEKDMGLTWYYWATNSTLLKMGE